MQDIQCQLTVSRGQFLADKRTHKKLTNFGFFFATLHFSTRSIEWTYLEEILTKFAYPTVVYKIPYRRARAWPSSAFRPSARASKGILHTNAPVYKEVGQISR